MYKSGTGLTGTRGRGHRDACVGTWDLGTRDEGLEDIKYGTGGRVGRGRGDVKYVKYTKNQIRLNLCDLLRRQILLQRQRFSQNYSSTHEAICRCNVSPRHVAATCRLVCTDLKEVLG